MPNRIAPLTLTQQVADIEKALRRRRLSSGQQSLIWQHQAFTAPATYQLSYIPYGINALSDNGSLLAEGTDYTVDYTTGLVTFGTARTSGHVIFVSYVTNGDLIAASLPADTGAITDTFNRANSGTIGTASDGGTWSGASNFSIVSNQAASNTAGWQSAIWRDPGNMNATVTVTLRQGAFGAAVRIAYIYFAYAYTGSPGTDIGYILEMSAGGIFGLRRLPSFTSVGTPLTGTSWSANSGGTPGGPSTIAASFNATTATVTVVQDGVTVGSISDPTPQALTGSYVGLADSNGYASSQITFDDFTAA